MCGDCPLWILDARYFYSIVFEAKGYHRSFACAQDDSFQVEDDTSRVVEPPIIDLIFPTGYTGSNR